MIKLLENKSSFLSRKTRSFLRVWALKIDVNLLNQHCKPADWLGHWKTDLLRLFDFQGTQGTQDTPALEHWRHSNGNWALQHAKHLRYTRHSKGTRALEVSRNLDAWALEALRIRGHLRHSDIRWALGHSCLKVLGHRGTRVLRHSKDT